VASEIATGEGSSAAAGGADGASGSSLVVVGVSGAVAASIASATAGGSVGTVGCVSSGIETGACTSAAAGIVFASTTLGDSAGSGLGLDFGGMNNTWRISHDGVRRRLNCCWWLERRGRGRWFWGSGTLLRGRWNLSPTRVFDREWLESRRVKSVPARVYRAVWNPPSPVALTTCSSDGASGSGSGTDTDSVRTR